MKLTTKTYEMLVSLIKTELARVRANSNKGTDEQELIDALSEVDEIGTY